MRWFASLGLALALGVMELSAAGCGADSNSLSLSDYCLDTFCPICSVVPVSDEVCLMSCVYGSPPEEPLCESEVIAVHECELEIGRCGGAAVGDPETEERCCEQIEAMDACLGKATPGCMN